jgi:hypothetical protein
MKKLILLTVSAIALSGAVQAQNIFALNDRINVYKAELTNEQKTEKSTKASLVKEKRALRKVENDQVSDLTKQNFYSDFGDVPVLKWQHGPIYDVVNFTKDGKSMEAYYEFNKGLIGTITPKVFSDLPDAAQKDINKHYEGYNPVNVIFYDDNENNDTDLIYGDDEFTEDNFFVQMAKDGHSVVLRVKPDGEVSFFKDMN